GSTSEVINSATLFIRTMRLSSMGAVTHGTLSCGCPTSSSPLPNASMHRLKYRAPGIRPRQSGHTSHVGAQHVAFDVINRLGLCEIISFAAQYPTPHDRCVRFATAVTGDHATLATGRLATALPWPDFHRLDRASFAWRTDNRYYQGQSVEARPLLRGFLSEIYPLPYIARARPCSLQPTVGPLPWATTIR